MAAALFRWGPDRQPNCKLARADPRFTGSNIPSEFAASQISRGRAMNRSTSLLDGRSQGQPMPKVRPPLAGAPAGTLLAQVGGRPALERVHKVFYDKLYAHPWLGRYFSHIDQTHIEAQQTDFVVQSMGGPKKFCGRLPMAAHEHMMISEELFDVRHAILEESLIECRIPEEPRERWLAIDRAFRGSLSKASLSDCKKRYNSDTILDFPKP